MTATAERQQSDPRRERQRLQPAPTPAEQAAFERRMARWLADVAEDWLRAREAGR